MDENPLIKFEVLNFKNGTIKKEFVEIVSEYTLNIKLNDILVSSLICLPSYFKELAVGYLVSEGYIKNIGQIKSINQYLPDIFITTKEPIKDIETLTELRSSGHIGTKQTWEQNIEKFKAPTKINVVDIFRAQKALNDKCILWQVSRGTHSAALFSNTGDFLALFEDTGRHGSIDKIIGYVYLNQVDPTKCFLVTTGRPSAGMLLKLIRAKIPIIVSKAVPMAQGIELAIKYDISLICFAREPNLSIYSGAERIIFP